MRQKLIIKKEFDDKLKQLRVKQRFVRGILTCERHGMSLKNLHPKQLIKELNKLTSFRLFINLAFNWADSAEGHEFWSNISNK